MPERQTTHWALTLLFSSSTMRNATHAAIAGPKSMILASTLKNSFVQFVLFDQLDSSLLITGSMKL
jgi:hypothetical protein